MEEEILLALMSKMVQEKVAEYISSNTPIPTRGPRGFNGPMGEAGEPGKSFIWDEHKDKILEKIHGSSLKFEDLSEDQKVILRGPRGRDGLDGRGFIWEDHEAVIRDMIKDSALKFSDLTIQQMEDLRGRPGRDGKDGVKGRDGNDFSFQEHSDKIQSIINSEILGLLPSLKLKFSDLSLDDVESLRGPRGQRGKPGKDFIFEEHAEFFKSLKMTFSDLTETELDSLKLKFSHLTEKELDSLKLKFESLTEEDRESLGGPRGQRGKPGRDGISGENGKDGKTLRGPVGPIGITGNQGRPGIDGEDGEDGEDAPLIEDIRILEYRDNDISLRVVFNNGTSIETNKISLPKSGPIVQNLFAISGGMGSGGGFGAFNNFSCGKVSEIDFDGFNLINCCHLPIGVDGTSLNLGELNALCN